MRHSMLLPLLGLVAPLAGCASSTVKVPVTDGASEFREVQKLDCRVYDERQKSLTVGLSFSALFGAVAGGPHVTVAESTGVKWDKSVQFIVAQYKEVCSRYNAGAVSQASYDTRIAEIDQLYQEALGVRQSADALIRGHSREAFGELDKETGAGDRIAAAQQVVSAVDALFAKTGQ